MLKFIIPVASIVIGLAGGVGASMLMFPKVNADEPLAEQHVSAEHDAEPHGDHADSGTGHGSHADDFDDGFVEVPGQFTVPVLDAGGLASMVVLSVSLEIDAAAREKVIHLMPRFQDAFLSALFDHARIGGFNGDFTAEFAQAELKRSLLRRADEVAEGAVHAVLVTEMARQDL